MAGLFELELDKMKNQYETVQRATAAGRTTEGEAEQRLEELARRQQQALEEQRRRQQGAANGSSSNQRQQELIEETRKAARELERLRASAATRNAGVEPPAQSNCRRNAEAAAGIGATIPVSRSRRTNERWSDYNRRSNVYNR